MRLAITGATRSGKSTALHLLSSHALRHKWAKVIMLDGKGTELCHYREVDDVEYYGPDAIEQWAALLEIHAEAMATRYNAMAEEGRREAIDSDPKYLIIADEVQKGTRSRDFGASIKESLTLISEQCAALHDVLILSSQREKNAIPPGIRTNINVWVRMLGVGYFQMTRTGMEAVNARTTYIEPDGVHEILRRGDAPLPFDPPHLPKILGVQDVPPGRAPVTIYIGLDGSGKSHAIKSHVRRGRRTIGLDLKQPHKQVLERLIERAGAVAPDRTGIPDLIALACLAARSEPTLLLLDNLESMTNKMPATIDAFINSVDEVAISCTTPETPAQHRKIEPFISRAKRVEIKPLRKPKVLELLHQHLPDIVQDMTAVENRILKLAKGHPKTIVQLATQTQQGTLEEIREYEAPTTRKPVSMGIAVLLIPIFFVLLLVRADGYMYTAAIIMVTMILRRVVMSFFKF